MREAGVPADRAGRPVSRRVFLRTAAGAIATWSLLGTGEPAARALARTTRATGAAARVIPFGAGWLFGPAETGSDQPGFADGALATVTLPHTVVPLSWQDWDPSSWERMWVYRKHFAAPAGTGGMRVFLDVAAALTHATATPPGTQVADHLGGYPAFRTQI